MTKTGTFISRLWPFPKGHHGKNQRGIVFSFKELGGQQTTITELWKSYVPLLLQFKKKKGEQQWRLHQRKIARRGFSSLSVLLETRVISPESEAPSGWKFSVFLNDAQKPKITKYMEWAFGALFCFMKSRVFISLFTLLKSSLTKTPPRSDIVIAVESQVISRLYFLYWRVFPILFFDFPSGFR